MFIFSDEKENRYELAMNIFGEQYGNKNIVIRAHHSEITAGIPVDDSIADFEKLANKFKCFHAVILYYNANMEFYSSDLVKSILDNRLSIKMSAKFTNFLCVNNYMKVLEKYLPRLTDWVNEKILIVKQIWAVVFYQNHIFRKNV